MNYDELLAKVEGKDRAALEQLPPSELADLLFRWADLGIKRAATAAAARAALKKAEGVNEAYRERFLNGEERRLATEKELAHERQKAQTNANFVEHFKRARENILANYKYAALEYARCCEKNAAHDHTAEELFLQEKAIKLRDMLKVLDELLAHLDTGPRDWAKRAEELEKELAGWRKSK